MTNTKSDYRRSHSEAGKGREYQANFRLYKWRAHLWSREQEVLKDIVGHHFGDRPVRHLDFACGTGRVLKLLGPHVSSSTGVDVSESMLEVCRAECPESRVLLGDVTQHDLFEPGSFDLITAFRFFPNAQDELRRIAITRLANLLAPGGILVFNNHKHSGSITFKILGLVGRSRRVMSFGEVERLVRAANLRIVSTHSMGCLPAEERLMLFPASVHDAADRVAGSLGLARHLGQNQIYVCCKQ
jgi:Methylase involved in ubiquinone/menaquinone biosynthesis